MTQRCRSLATALLALLALLATVGCASNERPEVVPGSTIATSSTTTTTLRSSTADDLDDDARTTSTTSPSTTSIRRLDPSDPNYPTTIPLPPRPTVSYPEAG